MDKHAMLEALHNAQARMEDEGKQIEALSNSITQLYEAIIELETIIKEARNK